MIINGRAIAANILEGLKREVAALPFRPVFCDVLVGDDTVSASYVRIKARSARQIGLEFREAAFPDAITAANLIKEIKKINREPLLCGLIVQLPLPSGFPRREILDAVDSGLDADCIGSVNQERFYRGEGFLLPPAAAAVLEILDSLPMGLDDKKIVMVGQGELVGKPVSALLRRRGLAVRAVDKYTADASSLLKRADVVISATGRAGLITGGSIKPGAVVIDAGTSESEGGIVGDVDFASVSRIAAAVSPVPGGVGPVTVAMLLSNVVKVAKNKL